MDVGSKIFKSGTVLLIGTEWRQVECDLEELIQRLKWDFEIISDMSGISYSMIHETC